jgi:Clp amino terminal domain, pathogenicity island component/TIR domain
MISQELEVSLHMAFVQARQLRHEYITVEHLLLGLLDSPSALQVLNALSANTEELRKNLTKFITENTPQVGGNEEVDTQPTLGFQRVIQRAIMHVQSNNNGSGNEKKDADGANVLMALFGEKDSHAVYYLHNEKITRLDVVNYIAKGIKKEKPLNTGENFVEEIAAKINIETVKNSNKKDDKRLRIFISYSHIDAHCLERLLVHLKPLERLNLIDCWSDKNIRTGDKWKPTLLSNLENAAVAVLLISADFLASDFIINQELPPLLLSAEAKGLRILPIILKPCGFLRDKSLNSIQSLNDPIFPLLGMNNIEQEHLYNKIAEEIHTEIESRRAI